MSDRSKRALLKRTLDLAIGGAALAATAPIMAAAGAAVAVTMGRPVLFRQTRAGKGGEPFDIYKFRTMRDSDPNQQSPETDAERLTKVGAFLRSTSIDELPTLLNVVLGDMSLVGPRPLYLKYNERYSPAQRRRLEVQPGVTGLAQVRGRNAIGWSEKFAYDVEYVERASVLLDLRILAETAVSVLRRDGIAAEGHVSMPEFMGDTDEEGAHANRGRNG